MSRMINGKTVADVIKELAAPFSEKLFKTNPAGFPYLPYEVFRERMDQVVGIFNYDFTISQTEWVVVGDKMHISCIGTLTIRDDEGNVVTVKSENGDADVICKKDGAVVKSGNDAKTASHDAFKSCCRMLGVGDYQLRDKRKGGKNNNDSSTSSNAGNRQQSAQSNNGNVAAASEACYRICVTGGFTSLNNKGYKAPAVLSETGEKVSLILWKEGIAAVEAAGVPIGEFLKKSINREFSVIGERTTFSMRNGSTEEQLIMLRPSNVKGA